MAQAMPFMLGASLLAQGFTTFRSAGLQRTAGKIAARESELEAKQIELAAIQREADRKGRLARALASQIVTAGASGIQAFEGSPLAILQADIEAEKKATERDKTMSQIAVETSRAKAKIQRNISSAISGTSLLSGLSSIGLQLAQTAKTLPAVSFKGEKVTNGKV